VLAPAGLLPQAAERLDPTPGWRSDPGHAAPALDLVRTDPGARALFDARLAAD
jgi:hypothetical protein